MAVRHTNFASVVFHISTTAQWIEVMADTNTGATQASGIQNLSEREQGLVQSRLEALKWYYANSQQLAVGALESSSCQSLSAREHQLLQANMQGLMWFESQSASTKAVRTKDD